MPAVIGSAGLQGSFWQLVKEDTSVAPPLPKLCHANPNQALKPLIKKVEYSLHNMKMAGNSYCK